MVSVFVGCICSSNGMTRECLHLSVVMGLAFRGLAFRGLGV